MAFNSLLSFVAFNNTFWDHGISFLLPQDTILFVFLVVISSLIICVIILSSMKQPTHSSAFSFCSHANLLKCYDNMVSLCCSLNLTLITLNSPVHVLHFFCSSSFNISTDLNPSWPGQFSITGGPVTFLCIMAIGHKKFFASISKFQSSWYMADAFQWNIGCLSTGSLDLGIALLVWHC